MDKESYKIRWTSDAYEDWKRIMGYLLEEWPAYVAANFADIFEKKLRGFQVNLLSGEYHLKEKMFVLFLLQGTIVFTIE